MHVARTSACVSMYAVVKVFLLMVVKEQVRSPSILYRKKPVLDLRNGSLMRHPL